MIRVCQMGVHIKRKKYIHTHTLELYNVSINSIRIGLTVPRWFKRIKVYYVSALNREKTG